MPVPALPVVRGLVLAELRKDRAFLLPLRLFIGLGWVRAGVEKVLDAAWYDGSALTAFLTGQLAWSQEAFPLYGAVMERVLLPAAAPVGWAVIALQLVAGVAIVVGYRTGPALFVGVLMNVNFVLAGVPDPSAFYIVIQLVLFAGGAGRTFGIDGLRLMRDDLASLSGAPTGGADPRRRRLYAVLGVTCLGFAASVAPAVSSLAPATVVEDPAMVLVVLAIFAAAIAGLGALGGPERSSGAPARDRGAPGHLRPATPAGVEATASTRWTPAGSPLR